MVDETAGEWLETSQIGLACQRRLGIGADGFMRLRKAAPHHDVAFEVLYYNADGHIGSLCGNGSRCAVEWAYQLGLYQGVDVKFLASDGVHQAKRMPNGDVTVTMADAKLPKAQYGGDFIDTGSPHHVILVDDVNSIDVATQGSRIRNQDYGPEGSNVNWLSMDDQEQYHIRTYERGVEAETLSCGTGAVASALVLAQKHNIQSPLTLKARGGDLSVSWLQVHEVGYSNVQLTGPTCLVFEGNWPW